MLPAEYLGYFWNCYRERFKTLWITGDAGIGKTYLLQSMAKAIPDSFYYSFEDGIDNFKKITGITEEAEKTPAKEYEVHCGSFVELHPKDDGTWFEDAIEKLAEEHSFIILDNFSFMFGYWGNRLFKVAEAQRRIYKKPVLLAIVSRHPMVMHPYFSMWIFNSRYNERISIQPASVRDSIKAGIYNNPKEAIYDCTVTGYFPPHHPGNNYEDKHNWHENILHLLEFRDYRLNDILKDIPDDKKEVCGKAMRDIAVLGSAKRSSISEEIELLEKANLIKQIDGYDFGSHNIKKLERWQCTNLYIQFFFKFIYDYHQKDPRYVTQEELEEYYQEYIAPYFYEYAESLCTRLFFTRNYKQCPVRCIRSESKGIVDLQGYVVRSENDKWRDLTICDFSLSDEPYSLQRLEKFIADKVKLTKDAFKIKIFSFTGFAPELIEKLKSNGINPDIEETMFGIKSITLSEYQDTILTNTK